MSDTPVNFDLSSHDQKLIKLLIRIKQGDERALAEFYDLTSSRVYSLALYVLNDSAMAEEVTLDVYLQIWQRAGQFDANRGKPLTWVTVLNRSRSIDRLRARHKEKEKNKSLNDVDEYQATLSMNKTFDLPCDQSQVVHKALASLSPEQCQVIKMAYFEGLSQREIAEKINKPLGTVKTRIRLGMINLRKTLNTHNEE